MVDVVASPGKPKTLRLQPGVDGYNGLEESYLDSWNPDRAHGAEDKILTAHPDRMFPTPNGEVSGRVWLDRNNNGQVDAEESGVVGVSVTLVPVMAPAESEPQAPAQSAVTGPNGAFQFVGLFLGSYAVAVVELPGLSPTTARKVSVELTLDAPAAGVSFGVRAVEQKRLYLPLIQLR